MLNHTLFGTKRIFHINPNGEPDCFFATPLIMDDTKVERLFNLMVWEKNLHTEWISLMTDIMLRVDVKGAETDDRQVSHALVQAFRDLPEWHLDGKTTEDLLKPRPDSSR